MASKQNDLMLNILANPHMSLGDFQSVGLSADNTSLEDENTYLNSTVITENPLFQNASGEFDKVKFHQKYLEAAQALQNMSQEQDFQPTYSKYNVFAPINQTDFNPQFELTKASNPDRLTKSMITLGQSGPREMTPAEIAQSQKVLNSETGEWMDTPEDMFSFSKLFNDFTGFFSDNFGSSKVMATYDEDEDINGKKRGEVGFNEHLIEHFKGDYKLNENGTYYYRTLKDGEDIYGKQLLHYSDILTREGSALNSIDFLDSDDIEKSPFGSFVKNAALIGSFFLPYVGTVIAGATMFQQAAGLGATLGKIALGNDNPTMNWIEGLVESTNPMETRSEHSQQENWTVENLLGMVGDVVGQLYQQRLLFKYAPALLNGKWGISEKGQEALRTKIIGELEEQNKGILSGITDIAKNQKAAAELKAVNEIKAAAQVEEYMKNYYKAGEQLSKAYMTMLTVNDIYGEAKEAGAEDFDAAVITAGYAAMEYALLSTDIGKWILPELRAERLQNKAIVRALSRETLDTFKKLGQEAGTSESAKRTYLQKLLNFGKSVAKGEFATGFGKRASIEGGEGLLKGGFGSLLAGASAEAIEETSEELLADFSRVLFNGLEQLQGKDTRLKPFENGFDRYTMSFLGGFLGGGISSASMDFSQARRASNMTYYQAMQEVIYKARNNQLEDLYKIVENNKIGNDKLSARETIKDDNGNIIWKQAEGNDNQDFVIKQNIKRQLDLIQNTLDAHGGNLTDSSLLDAQTLRDIRFRALHQSVTAGRFIQHYNELLTELIDNTTQLQNLNSPQAKAEANEGDRKDQKSPELETKRKKIEDRIKKLDKQIEDFTSGKLAPLFMTSALLESTPFIVSPFMTSTFRYYAEQQAKTKFENIPENELKKYLVDYQNYLRTSKKDDLKLATQGYLSMQTLIRDNFEQAKKLAEDSENDSEIKNYIENFTNTLSIFSQNLLQMDDDTWVEKLQEFTQSAKVGDQLVNQVQLLRNTIIENNTRSEEKRNKMVEDATQAFESGTIDEETKNNTINVANQEYQQEISHNQKQFNKQREQFLLQGQLQAAQNLADRIINLGYINGAIKYNILAQLESAKESATQLGNQIDDELMTVSDDQIDSYVDLSNNLTSQIGTLDQKIESIKGLSYTPILQNLDSFALSLNGGNVSGILEELGNQINSNRGSLSAFTLQGDVYKQVNEALRTIDLYIAALEGARTDTVDPFKVGVNTRGEAIDKSNIWGINRTLNEVHAKSPKIENDTWQDLPEIDGATADMMITDARSIKKLLNTYKRLYNINEGQKLNVQTRVATKTSYLLYDRIKRLLANTDLYKDFNTSELQKALTSLSFLEEQTSKDKKDWNINLSQDQQTKLEKERIILEDAIYNFFNVDNPNLATDVDKLKQFLSNNFNLLDIRIELLSEGATDIDETSIIGYIASKAAIKSSDFYGKFKDILDGKIAPIINQELGVQLQLGNILNGNVITSFINAYREILKDNFRNSDFEGRKKILEKYGEHPAVAELFAADEGSKYYPTHDSVPQFTNITFIDGIPGSGKSAGVDSLVIKFLQKYHPDILKNVWVSHGGDTSDTHPFTTKFRQDIGLGENPEQTFSKDQLMKKISNDWSSAKTEDGKTYEIKESDYTIEDGQITPTWKLNNLSESEIPSLIVIDEAQQFTQFDLMTIDKFARQHGIAVVMSGDLQQSKAKGKFTIPKASIQEINRQLKANKSDLQLAENTEMTIGLSRNQTLHTPKLGTSMRTANNQKNANLAAMQLALAGEENKIKLHYYESDNAVSGDFLINPNDIDSVIKLIDKIIPNLEENEKINYAYDKPDSKILQALKGNKKYADRINFIQGTALGQEGNYWIVEPNYSIASDSASVSNIEDFLSDLYTGISRSKKAGIVISPETLNGGQITLSSQQDLETHEITYSLQAIEKYAKKRIDMLKEILGETYDIEYKPRNSETPPSTPPITPTTNPPAPPTNPSAFDDEVDRLRGEGKISTTTNEEENIKHISEKDFNIDDLDFDNNYYVIHQTLDDYVDSILENGLRVPQGLNGTALFANADTIKGSLQTMREGNGHRGSTSLVILQFPKSNYDRVIRQLDDLTFDLFDKGILQDINVVPSEYIVKVVTVDTQEDTSITSEDEVTTDPVTGKEIQEVISDLDVANERGATEILEGATIDDNPNSDEEIEPTGLSLEDFSFFLFTNSTFELGTNLVDRQNNTYQESQIPGRIDGVNGLKNCPNAKSIIGNLQRAEKLIGNLRRYALTIRDKAQLEKIMSSTLGLKDGVYVRFAIKTSEFDQNFNRPEYSKLEKEANEHLPYARAQEGQSESNLVNPRSLVAIVGTETNGDAIEVPILTLNNPITLLSIHDLLGNYKFPDVHNVYESAYNNAIVSGYDWKRAQMEGLDAVLAFTNGKPEYKAIENLTKLYKRTDRNILFIKDQQWTPTNNLHSFGPQLHLHRGEGYYDNLDYIQEKRWISLDTLKADPTLAVTGVYQLLDKSEQSVKLAQPKHPFVLYTDSVYDHNGNIMRSDRDIIKEYLWQKANPSELQSIKLVYVLPPKFTLLEYVNSLQKFMENKQGTPLGNQRTPYKILETLLLTDVNATRQLFENAFDKDTGEQIYNKVVEVVSRLKDLDVQQQVKELQKVEQWPNLNGVGLTTKVNLYRHLQHIIKQLVYPGGVTYNGLIVLKGNGTINQNIFNQFNSIFEKSGQSLFYQSRASKNAEDVIEGIFSPVQVDSNGHINDDNISQKDFSINGNISSSTFLAEKEFNEILDDLVNNTQNQMQNGNWGSWDNPAYTRGYSGWNTRTQPASNPTPTIDKSITDKLAKFGITTNIKPNSVNDNSIALKQSIADEINSGLEHIAIVLPNGELLIGSFRRTTPVTIKSDSNSFESNQQYQFEVVADSNITYKVTYNPITKQAEFSYDSITEGEYNLDSFYEEIEPAFVEQNLDRFKQLLDLISTTNDFDEDSRETARELYQNGISEQIAEFLNDSFGIMNEIAEINVNDFDKGGFVDILKFEQAEDSTCPISFNVQFV